VQRERQIDKDAKQAEIEIKQLQKEKQQALNQTEVRPLRELHIECKLCPGSDPSYNVATVLLRRK
jgi:hypothetical protein